MKNKTKKILIIALSVMLIGLIGAMGAIFGKTDWNNLKNKVNELIQQEQVIESRNLIKNSNFSINTSGETIFTHENVTEYGIPLFDNWQSESSISEGCVLVVSSNGIYAKLNEDYSANNFLFGQRVENIDEIFGQTVTLTFSVDGVVYSRTFDFVVEDESYEVKALDNLSLVMCRYPSTSLTNVVVRLYKGFEGTINWVQLELGNVFTGYKG